MKKTRHVDLGVYLFLESMNGLIFSSECIILWTGVFLKPRTCETRLACSIRRLISRSKFWFSNYHVIFFSLLVPAVTWLPAWISDLKEHTSLIWAHIEDVCRSVSSFPIGMVLVQFLDYSIWLSSLFFSLLGRSYCLFFWWLLTSIPE